MKYLNILIILVFYFLIVIGARAIIKKYNLKGFKKILLVIAVIIAMELGSLAELAIWNASTRSDDLSEAFEKSWITGEIINTVENDDVAVVVVEDDQEKSYFTFKKKDGNYTLLANDFFKRLSTDVVSKDEQSRYIIRYECPKNDYVYVEIQIMGTDLKEEIKVVDTENNELPFYTTQYDSGVNVYEIRSFFALVPEGEEFYVAIDGERYTIAG